LTLRQYAVETNIPNSCLLLRHLRHITGKFVTLQTSPWCGFQLRYDTIFFTAR